MAASQKSPTETPLHIRLLDGLTFKSRSDGSVHTVKTGTHVVAEVCVGTKKVRLNFRAQPKASKSLTLSGKSKSWPAGGIVVDAKNLNAARAALASVTAATPSKPSAAP
jgi:hypothetical protein